MGSCLSLRAANAAAAASGDCSGSSKQRKRRSPGPRPLSASGGAQQQSVVDAATAVAGGEDASQRGGVYAMISGEAPGGYLAQPPSTGFDRFFAAYASCSADGEESLGGGNSGRVGAGGVARLCRDLCLDPVDIRVLLLAWLCRAREMCAFTEAELRRGCVQLHVAEAPTPDGLRAALDDRLKALTGGGSKRADGGEIRDDDSETAFKDLYRWAFDFGLESGQRTLQLPMATDLWALVFQARPSGVPQVLASWLAWLQSGASGVKGVSRDTWNMLLTFVDTCGSDLSAYDHNEAWPSLIDDFVEAETDRANQNLNC